MPTVLDHIWVCEDCQAYINGDVTSYDHWYSPDEAERRLDVVTKAVESFAPAYLFLGDGYDEFSRGACECCGSTEGGTRHEVIVVTNAETGNTNTVLLTDGELNDLALALDTALQDAEALRDTEEGEDLAEIERQIAAWGRLSDKLAMWGYPEGEE